MGWGGGTDIFDDVAWYVEPYLDNEEFRPFAERVLMQLLSSLLKQDWDIKCESTYYDDPVIGKILGNPEFIGGD